MYHVRCSHPRCSFHVRARGDRAAEEAEIGHEDSTGHDVYRVADELVEFVRASELRSTGDPRKVDA
ncbi:hypothetical protein SAMN04488063_0114 [Halopelagius inordinatus]|uniref:Uncharacterized protein n=2 Tax=Halopelagius inordinatus TaxID=553467 RepID=A0A1I2X2S3_9EURY|nr:hypothetical protein SAMN04488063_0114 [Halopelagius inordinatus]